MFFFHRKLATHCMHPRGPKMSALGPKADMLSVDDDVRLVPEAVIRAHQNPRKTALMKSR